MQRRIDLHTHTVHSDGRLSPADLVHKAYAAGVRVLAITDHDTTTGLAEALQHPGRPNDLELMTGIEVSASGDTSTSHILGYGFRVDDAALQSSLARWREHRIGRLREMIDKLRQLGIEVSFERVQALAGEATLGRPHLADALVEKKIVKSRQEAFKRFLSHDGPAYAAGGAPSTKDVIALLRAAGGVPVLAHPAYYCNEDFLRRLVDEGLMGIEVYYPDVSRALRERFLVLARTFGLVATGGSDYHGPRTGRSDIACVHVPETTLEELERVRSRL